MVAGPKDGAVHDDDPERIPRGRFNRGHTAPTRVRERTSDPVGCETPCRRRRTIPMADERIPWWSGRTLQAVRGVPHNNWVFDFGEGCMLSVGSPWRIRDGNRIRLGDCDHDQQFGLPAPVDAELAACDLLKGRAVCDLVLAEGTADLTIEFEGGLRLEVFNNSSGYEGWQLAAPGGRLLVALGDGDVARWSG